MDPAEPQDVTAPTGERGVDLRGSLRSLAFLAGDPTVRLGPGRFERATVTPDGAAALRVEWPDEPTGGAGLRLDAWGPGADWVRDRWAGLLGSEDDPGGFEPPAGELRRLWRRHRGLRLVRTRTVWHDLAWWILQQRVRLADAADAWRALVRATGAAAPGPVDLLVPPTPDRIGELGYADAHPLGIERSRAETLRAAAREIPRLQAQVDGPYAEVEARLAAVRGVGPWTQAGVRLTTWGDPDTVPEGDAGLPSMVAWLLAREPRADDARMLELLEPYRPHRARVLQLVVASGITPPRRGPRLAPNPIRRR